MRLLPILLAAAVATAEEIKWRPLDGGLEEAARTGKWVLLYVQPYY